MLWKVTFKIWKLYGFTQVRIILGCKHTSNVRTHRVIRMDQGHALLVGVGGSGRQSLARLAAFAAGCEVFEITLSRGYGEEEFREDLKQLYNKLGLENKKVGREGGRREEGRK